MKKLAITGGIAMGKSTVLRELLCLGVPVASCDKMARTIYLSDEIQAYCAEYGRKIGYSGPIEIEVTRDWMLNRLDFKSELESMMFPKIIQAMDDAKEEVVEVPLLYELGLEKRFETIWAVLCKPDTQLQRLTDRLSGDRDQAIKLIGAQIPGADKATRADFVIDTECDLIDLEDQIKDQVELLGLVRIV